MIANALIHLGYVLDVDFVVTKDGATETLTWLSGTPQPSQATIDAAKLPAAQAGKLAEIRAAAKAQIESQYPAWRQTNAALGLLPQPYVDAMNAHITAVIAASNTAENAVAAATTVDEVQGVTPVWP